MHTRRLHLGWFLRWCAERDLQRPSEVTQAILERYQRHLYQRRKADDTPLTPNAQYNHLISIKMFYRWLTRQHHVLNNPAADLEMPKLPKHLPMDVLSAEEAERVLTQPNIKTPLGLRDRVVLEVLYSTGLRRGEVAKLDIDDVDFHLGVVRVHHGKGNKDRVVPIGERALLWLKKYLDEVRPHYTFGQPVRALFLGYEGDRMVPVYFGHIIRRYLDSSGVNKKGCCHLFRHSFATLMLENGADIRYIQAMLGHEKLETTQIYTRVAIEKLKQVHRATHPAALWRGHALTRDEHDDETSD